MLSKGKQKNDSKKRHLLLITRIALIHDLFQICYTITRRRAILVSNCIVRHLKEYKINVSFSNFCSVENCIRRTKNY